MSMSMTCSIIWQRTARCAILLYLEGIRDARNFMSAARAAARIKPVIVLKAGRHPEGARAATSHTGAMAGSDAVYDAAFERAGLVRAADLGDLFQAAEVLSRLGRIASERLAILTNGGGAGVLAVDRLKDLGGVLANLSPETVFSLDKLLPAAWSRANPLDIIGDAGPDRYAAAYRALQADPSVDAILALNCPTAVASSTDATKAIATACQEARSNGQAKPTLGAWLGAAAVAEGHKVLDDAGIPSFETPAMAVEAFMHLIAYQRSQSTLMPTPVISQPMVMAVAPAPAAMFCGKLNTPEPIIEPTTSAVSSPAPNLAAGTVSDFVVGPTWGMSIEVMGHLLSKRHCAEPFGAARHRN
jgi:acetyltransferase